MTQQKSSRKTCRISTLFAEDFLARAFQSQENGEALKMPEEPCSLKLLGSLPLTAEILPTIRKTGGYVANEDVFVETYLPFADEPIKQLFRIQCRVINQLNERIRKDEPKVKFADHVGDSTNVIDVNRMAKKVEKAS